MKSLLSLLSLLLTATLSISAAAPTIGSRRDDAGWLPIKDLDELHVRAIALFAMTEQNKNSLGPVYLLQNVVSGETKGAYDDAGVVYRLGLMVSFLGFESYAADFEAIVWDKGYNKFQLMSFRRS